MAKRTRYLLSDSGLQRLKSEMERRNEGRGLTYSQFLDLMSTQFRFSLTTATIRNAIKRERPSYYGTIEKLFKTLGLVFGSADIKEVRDVNHTKESFFGIPFSQSSFFKERIMNPEVLNIWQECEQKGVVATIHTCSPDKYPSPYRFSSKTNIGLDSASLSRTAPIALVGAWYGKEHLLAQAQQDLLKAGELEDVITYGSAWEPCSESDAPAADDAGWQSVWSTPPGVTPTDFVYWGQNSLVWLKSAGGLYVTNPAAQYRTQKRKIIEIDGVAYSLSTNVERIA
ncbi:MAG TPA: hypothetical protein V6D33_09005 [Cyanophyceae cyanobacterium]